MPNPVDFVGTISKDSLNNEDLIKTFMAFLDYYWPEKAEELRWEFSEVFDSLKNPVDWTDDGWETSEHIAELGVQLIYGKIWDALNKLAPKGYQFCENPKDFTDFGYWEEKKTTDKTCPACLGTGVLDADGLPTTGCSKCWGTGEIE